MGRFKIQILLQDDTWNTQYTIPKNSQFSTSSTDWTLLNLDSTVGKFGVELFFNEPDSPHSDMSFSIITITHSVY